MNKHLILAFFFILFSSYSAYSLDNNTPSKLKGVVIDAKNNEPVPFAGIIIVGTKISTVTDIDGNFTLASGNQNIKIKVTSIGYETETKQINIGQTKSLIIKLKPESKELEEIVVRVGKKKYQNKKNPAVELIEKVIENKKNNKQESVQYFENEKYEKIQFALSDITPEFKKKKAFKKFQFVFENTDTTKLKGKEILPIYIKENLSDYYFQKNPHKSKEIIKANKKVSFDGYVDDQGMAEYLKYLYQDINIYDNNVTFLTNQFLSPIASTAPVFYKYYIIDTTKIGDSKCVKIFFSPRNKTDMLFQGYLYILLDSSYAIKQIDMSVNKEINLNWVKEVKIAQTFDKIEDQGWMLVSDEIGINFGFTKSGMGMYGQRTVSYKKYNFKAINDSIFKGLDVTTLDSANYRKSDYWNSYRHVPLSKSENGTYGVMDSIQKVPAFRQTMDIISLIFMGYKDMGYYEIGPVNTFYSYNPIEGVRFRFGGRTTPRLNKRLIFETYLAYGLEDKKYKYYLGATYSLTPRSIYEFPVKSVKISYQDETKIPGQDLQFVQEDNILLSIKRGVNDKLFYNKTFKIEHLNEFSNHFSYSIGYQYTKQAPGGNLFFNYSDYLLHQNDMKNINISELALNMRYAPHEQFYQGKLYRVPITNEYPIFEMQYNVGLKLIQNNYNYQRLRLSVYKRFYFSVFGYTDVVWEASKIFGQVPYPLLVIHHANQTYSYQILSYNMMNFLEFVSDQYTSVNIDHCFNGFIFNKIPLFKKLKWREVVSCKVLYGSVSKQNNPDYHSNLFKFPVDYDGTPITNTLEKKPYIEASAGVGNIFKVFRIDVVKRLTYLDNPNVANIGIRVRFKLDF